MQAKATRSGDAAKLWEQHGAATQHVRRRIVRDCTDGNSSFSRSSLAGRQPFARTESKLTMLVGLVEVTDAEVMVQL